MSRRSLPLLPRRTFLTSGLAASVGCLLGENVATSAVAGVPAVNAFSRLKQKLASGESATLLIISDSTGYRADAGTRRFIRWLATQYPSHRVTEWYWAEWVTNAPTGPRNYGEPIVISEGQGASKPTLTLYNAVLPGAVAQAMIDGSRWNNMIAPLQRQAPDLVLWNHGHNHQANLQPKDHPYGRGSFLAPIGRVGLEFPKTPQAAIIQNPWRDNDGYDRVREWWLAAAAAMPSLTLVDGHAPFLARNKAADLYQDNVHPNAKGYELIYQALIAAWESTTPQMDVLTDCWATLLAEPLVANGDLATWAGEMPDKWRTIHNAKVQKDTSRTFRDAPYSLALTGTTQNDGLQISITGEALAKVRGKTVSIAVLCFVPKEAEQDIQVKFTTNSSDQVTGSTQFARDNWKWIVMAGCVVPPEASLAFVGIFRSFAKPPTAEVPFYIQKLVIVEGAGPKGAM
ncbi:SGNH/GDSL hydrolase family protein [Verrucomicrobium sp. BvORR034]|uniref:SGNH/GDSL hydrolase family protein n=1 Tax=Verrucomicrobium sp. BvORR034 TaxID=1396418 RepID=UPI002240F90B|nr:SGNH/GDSL hydrolase family protein [Verrucomicrobium sp. BvORR034]